MSLYAPPRDLPTRVFTRMPDELRRPDGDSDWGRANKPGQSVPCFLEGPSFDRAAISTSPTSPMGASSVSRPAANGAWSSSTTAGRTG